MDIQAKKIVLSNKIKKHLLQTEASVGYVAGWDRKAEIVCVSVSASSDYFIAGLEIVGFFCQLDENVPDNEVLGICEKQFGSLQLEMENPIVLFVKKDIISSKLYSTYYGTLTDVAFEEYELSSTILVQACGQVPLVVELATESETLKENVELAVEKVRTNFQSQAVAFLLRNCNVMLHSLGKSGSRTVRDLLKVVADNDSSENVKTKKGAKRKTPISFEILLQTSGDAALENTFNHSVVVHCQRREFRCASFSIPLDVVAVCRESTSTSDVFKLLQTAIDQQLLQMSQCLHVCARSLEISTPVAYHFYPDIWEFPVTIVYPLNKSDQELENTRRELHRQLMLPLDRPFLKKVNACDFSSISPAGHLCNPHEAISSSGVEGGKCAVVQGKYSYHHYMQDHMNDNGWGCAYRSLQTIVSWFKYQGYATANVPTHTEIQEALVKIGDKPQNFVGSKKWIGSQEVSFCLDHLLQIQSKIMFVSSGAEMANKGRELFHHFKDQGTPIMIGGGVLAHTILGVDFNQDTGELKFLILDPHYTGGEDLNIILNKGWCGWKNIQFWDQTAFYNLCLPQRPLQI